MYRLWLDYDWAILKPSLLLDFYSVMDTSNKNMLLSLHKIIDINDIILSCWKLLQ